MWIAKEGQTRDSMVASLVRHVPFDELCGRNKPITWKTYRRWFYDGYIIRKGQRGTRVYWLEKEDDGIKTFTSYHLFSEYQVDKKGSTKKGKRKREH